MFTPLPHRWMMHNYIIALGIVGLLGIISFAGLHYTIDNQIVRASVINVSGRQRMLSQHIGLLSMRLVTTEDSAERAALRRELRESIVLMERSHAALIKGNTAMELPRQISPAIHALYFEPPVNLDQQVHRFLAYARSLAVAPASVLTLENTDLQYIQTVGSTELLAALDSVVEQHEIESNTEIFQFQMLESGVLGLTLLVLTLEGFLIFRPMVRRVQADFAERLRAEEALQESETAIRALYEITATQHDDFDSKVQALLEMGCQRFRLPIGLLSRIENEQFSVVAVRSPENTIARGDTFALADTYCSEVVRANTTLGVEHVAASTLHAHPCYAAFYLEAYLGTPVMVQGQLYGTLCFSSPTPSPVEFATTDKDVLRLMAQWLGSEIERIQAAAALRESEERFRRLSEATVEGVAISEQGIIVDANQPLATMLGYNLAEIIGRNALDFVVPECRPMIADHIRLGYEKPYEAFGLRCDGSIFPIEVNGKMIPYYGRTARVTAIRDITARKLVEVALRSSEERFRQLAEHIEEVFWMSSPAMDQIIYVSPAYEPIWGRTCASLYEQPGSMLAAVHPDDQERVLAAQVQSAREPSSEEYRIVRPDGTTRWIWTRAFPVRNDRGEVYRIVGISEDITGRKRAEAELRSTLAALEVQYQTAERARSESRAIFDASNEAMVLMAPDGLLLSVNRRFSELFGILPDVVLDHHFDSLQEEVNRIFVSPDELRALVAGSALDDTRQFKLILVQRWPEHRELELSSTPVRSTGGAYLGRLYVFRDVTRERAVDRMKSEFVSLVSHELRTPLTSIKGYVDLLLEGEAGPVNAEHRELLEIVNTNANRLVALINDLLDISRIESGKVELNRVPLDLAHLIRQVGVLLRPQIAAKQQHLTLDVPGVARDVQPLPTLFGDADRLTQVLINLLSNAYKYTPAGGCITVTARALPGYVRVDVQDTGIGLAPDEIPQLFTKFFRAKNRTTQEVGGTGLGLTITQSLVELHGGEMLVTSVPGQGSTFSFVLPTAPETAACVSHGVSAHPGVPPRSVNNG